MKKKYFSLFFASTLCFVLISGIMRLDISSTKAAPAEAGTPVVTGSPNLGKSVQVFPYDVDIYGIYLVQGDLMTPVVSVPVEHINIDKVTAKLSPDGLKVAYLVEYGSTGFSQLFVVGIDGLTSNILFESEDPGRYITSFAWSHDSEQVAYSLSKDTFASGPDATLSFNNPDEELDPNAATESLDSPLNYTGEVWLTDLDGLLQEQIIDQGAMDILGWTSDDTGVLFTRVMTETIGPESTASTSITNTRLVTPTTTFATALSIVQTDAISMPTTTDLLTTSLSGVLNEDQPLYTGFYLLETPEQQQKLAVTSTALPFETLPITDTMLSLVNLESLIALGNAEALDLTATLASTAILTNTESIVNVSISPDGSQIAYLTEGNGGLWASEIDGLGHTEVISEGLSAEAPLAWGTTSNSLAAASLMENSLQVLDIASGTSVGSLSAQPSDELTIEPLGASVKRSLNAPYIHQVWDTPNWFAGYCACGPTSTAMALAYYGKITPHPITISSPYSHTNDYGFYVAEKYGSYNSRWAWDCDRNLSARKQAYGLYGYTMVSSTYRAAKYEYIVNAIKNHGLSSRQDWTPTFDEVKAAIDRNHVVIVGTKLTRGGHIVLIKGYTSDGRIIVHDPFGNFRKGSYGQYNGSDSWYYWNDLMRYGRSSVFNTIEVIGTSQGSQPPQITHWKGEYYNNRSLSGSPSLVRNDQSINFGWGTGSPASGISSDNFSVRWTRTMRFDRGVYRFRTTSDDGVRLWIDGRLVINAWYDQGATNRYTGNIFLSGGNHTIKMEYYEHGGGATARLNWWRVAAGSSTGWQAQYYNNRYLSGSPTFTRTDDSIYFNWGSGGPGGGVGTDNFSVRWTKTLNVPASGYYRFYARTDDGVRVWVDGRLRISSWRDQGATTRYSRALYLTKGNHDIKVEYYEHGGAAYARVWMQPLFKNEYFNNTSLSGNPRVRWYTTYVWNNWGGGSPSRYIRRYDFSARYTGNIYVSGGKYQFCTRTDDGVRLYIDGQRVINRWRNQAATTYCTSRSLSQGFHGIKMEYYEHYGLASAKLWWRKYGSGFYHSDPLQQTLDQPFLYTADTTEAELLSLYNDAGYLGPIIEADVPNAEQGIYDVMLPAVMNNNR